MASAPACGRGARVARPRDAADLDARSHCRQAPFRLVLYPLQVQPFGTEGRRALAAVLREQNLFAQDGGCAALADINQHADEVAHHVVQEGVGAHDEVDALVASLSTVNSWIRRTGDFAWHSEERKAEKSCSPTSSAAASRIALDVERQVEPADAGLRRAPGAPGG